MALIVLMMVSMPGLYDTKRRAIAVYHYHIAPSETAKREVEEAKRLDRRDTIIFGFVLFGVFGLSTYTFVWTGRKITRNTMTNNPKNNG